MKITRLEAIPLRRPVQNAFGGSQFNYDVGGHLLVRVFTDEGFTGSSTIYFGLIASGMETVKLIIDRELAPRLIGENPHFVRKLRDDMHAATEYYGTVGVACMAVSAVDTALWDIIGQAAGVPTAYVLGARRDQIRAYAMVGWYFKGGLKELVAHCEEAAEEGFPAVKIKIGRGDLADDVARVKAVRSALGEDFRVMVDANCAFDEMEALRRGHAFEELDVYWFEEPLKPQFLQAHARLREKLRIPIAIGENYFTRFQFYEAIRAGCADIVQPDNRRAGGVTEWMDIAAISETAGVKLASHLGGPGNVNVMCAIENALYLECEGIKKDNEMLVHPLTMRDGMVQLPQVPGMAGEIKPEYIEAYRLDK